MTIQRQTEIEPKTWWESVRIAGEQLGTKIESLIREGNVRRVLVRQQGRTIAEFPLTIGVVGAAVAPVVAAIGAIAALATECTVEVERVERVERVETDAPVEPAEKTAALQTDETVETRQPALSR
ncbi:MAG TPA: DUF4342 domain-containing protein [Chloroflexota bacterium]|nr:DUF4342 domain-containing protein [Chloroflexota bacterium]